MLVKITILRKKLNLTQAALAKAAGATQQQIALIENGQTDPRLSTLYKIAAALGTDIGGLFFSQQEFVEILNKIIKNNFSGKNMSLPELNTYFSEHHNISSYDPNWSKVTINKSNKISIKKEI